MYGLSPLARGTPQQPSDNAIWNRFIPAGAGNSDSAYTGLSRHAVYPRWRGELGETAIFKSPVDGLSPLARGTLREPHHQQPHRRFIPAGAGNSAATNSVWAANAVYPRWRGELAPAASVAPVPPGLSPLARGTQRVHQVAHVQNRFIPAGAGNSSILRPSKSSFAVYPRWRGELESSLQIRNPLGRFIPAGAGNSAGKSTHLALIAVYPRWRGELLVLNEATCERCGLSPLARGTLNMSQKYALPVRFIPAGAGNSPASYPPG